MEHPMAAVIRDAAAGSWPPVDGAWTPMPAWRPGLGGVFAFTGHAYVCTDRPVDRDRLNAVGCNGFGGATGPQVMVELAGPDAWIDCLDVLMVARGRGLLDPALRERPDLAGHDRAGHARLTRDAVRTYGYADPRRCDLVTVGSGPAGLPTIGVEAERPGAGATLFADVLDLLPADLVLASVAPGNARSLRAALRAGFRVIGSIQLFHTTAHPHGVHDRGLPSALSGLEAFHTTAHPHGARDR